MSTPGMAPFGSPMPAVAAPADAPGDDPVEQSSFTMGILVLLMVLWSSVGHQIAARTKYIGDASTACAMGLFTGLAVLVLQRYISADAVHQLLTFNPAEFFTYLLPPIIFYAGLSVKKKQFFRNFSSITLFGVLGTYISSAVIAGTLFVVSRLPGNSLVTLDSLALGVIFAATDSVSVIQVLQQDRAPLLYSLVFGEGVLNDAVSVALLRVVQGMERTGKQNVTSWTGFSLSFLSLLGLSLLLGASFGLGASFLMRTLTLNSTPQEVALLGMLGYLSYLCGEWTGLSGIVALFCCAVIISHYGLHNVSPVSRITMVRACETLSYLSEGAIFIYVGMDTLDPLKWGNTFVWETLWLVVLLTLLTMMGRAAFVFPFSLLHNCWSREKLSWKEMVVIWWAGLMRGAVSVALVYYYFDPKGQSQDSHHATLIVATLVVVLFSVMVLGALTKPLLDFMLPPGDSREPWDHTGVTWHATESEWDMLGDSPRSRGNPLARLESHDTLVALEAEGEGGQYKRQAKDSSDDGDYQYQPLEKATARPQLEASSGAADAMQAHGPAVGYPGSVGLPRYLQGSGTAGRGRGPAPQGLLQLQPLGIEGVRDPLGRSGVGPRLRDGGPGGIPNELPSFDTSEPSPWNMQREASYTGRLGRLWAAIDERYLQPIFGGPSAHDTTPRHRASYVDLADRSESMRLLR
eukprot:jgi/Botrbrau1/2864/Bobra.0036s0009.1